MVLMCNKDKKPYSGVEIGRRGLSIRGIDVISDEAGQYGSVEIGMDFGSIINNVKKNLGFEAGVFVDDKKMSDVANLLQKPDAERIVGGFRNTESTDWNAVRSVVTPDFLRTATDVTTRLQAIGGVDYGFVAIPLLDFKGTGIGAVVAVKNFSEFTNQINSALIRSLSMSFLQGLVLVLLMFVLINSFFVHPAAEVKAEVKKE
jgi:methyl-accepting chemotaxis protein